MAEHAQHDSHGNTVAAWACVGLLMVSALVFMLAVILASLALAIVGGVVLVIALVVGKLLALAGYGAPRPSETASPSGS